MSDWSASRPVAATRLKTDLVSSIHLHRHYFPFSITIINLRQNAASPFSTTMIAWDTFCRTPIERSRWYDLQLVSLSVNAFSSFSLRQKRAFPLMKNSQNAFPSFVTDVMLANNGWVHAASRVYPPELHWLQRIRALRSQYTLRYLWKDTENSGRHQPRWAEGVSPNDAERRLKKHPQVLVAAPFYAQEKEKQTRKQGQCYIAL